MSVDDVQQQRDESRDWNVDLLLDAGFSRAPRSNFFATAAGCSVLSPGISLGQHHRRLFDVREANLRKIQDRSRAALLLRFVPEGFAFIPLEDIAQHFNSAAATHGKNSGVLYRYSCDLDVDAAIATVRSVTDKSVVLHVPLINKAAAEESLLALC